MKDGDIAKLVNELTAIAKEYGQTQQLRDRIANRLVPTLKRMQKLEEQAYYQSWIDNPDRMGR